MSTITFNIPSLWSPDYTNEITCCLNTIATCAFYLAGDDEMGLENTVKESGSTIDEYDPESTYEENYQELIDIVGGYNYFIVKGELTDPLLDIIVDEEKTNMLKHPEEYKIFNVILKEK